MAKHPGCSIGFKRQMAQEHLAAKTPHGSPGGTTSRATWCASGSPGTRRAPSTGDVVAADIVQAQEARISCSCGRPRPRKIRRSSTRARHVSRSKSQTNSTARDAAGGRRSPYRLADVTTAPESYGLVVRGRRWWF